MQFVCLAFKNAVAAQINGYTIHHWSGIPVRTDDGSGTGDRHKQSIKCQALRVVIIDEVSMVSMLKVLGWRGSAPWFLRKKLVAVWRPMAGGSRLSGCGARAGEETYFIVTTTTRLLELESGDSGETRTPPPQAGRIKA